LSILRTEEIERTMLDFIFKNKGRITKNDLVAYMDKKGYLSRVPTLRKIHEFESTGKINISRGKGNRKGQAHHLSINNQNVYNRIYNWLTEIEDILNKINVTREIIQISFHSNMEQDEFDYYNLFIGLPRKPISSMLHFLLILTNKLIQSEKDSQLLNMRIVDLFLKLDRKSDTSTNELEELGKDLEQDILLIKNDLQHPRIYEFSEFHDSSEVVEFQARVYRWFYLNLTKFKSIF
jgi:hypothetical protein